MGKETDLYKAATGNPSSMGYIKASPAQQVPIISEGKAEEGIDYGIIVLPPVADEQNPEVEAYPEDYIKYCQGRMRTYKGTNGELPQWEKKEAPGEDNAIEVDT